MFLTPATYASNEVFVHIVTISGSIRAASLHRALLTEFARILPAPHTVTQVEISELPHYSEDRDALGDRPAPASVTTFRDQLAAADAIVFASPEYNHGYSGTLKNAIDWASRPYGKGALMGKHVAVIGGGGMTGGIRGQVQLRQVLNGCGCHVLPRPELAIRLYEAYKDGVLVDPKVSEMLGRVADALIAQASK